MNRYAFVDNVTKTKHVRVDRRVARRLWRAGNDIIICACNMRPDSIWRPYAHVLHESAENWFDTGVFADFLDYYETTFAAYNCSHETGYYLAYYVPESLVTSSS